MYGGGGVATVGNDSKTGNKGTRMMFVGYFVTLLVTEDKIAVGVMGSWDGQLRGCRHCEELEHW